MGHPLPFIFHVEGLRQFIKDEVLPWLETRRKELANRSLICQQAFGESLKVEKLEQLGRYEVHLDRKLERMLAMLSRLKELRRPAENDCSVSQTCLAPPWQALESMLALYELD